MKVLVFDTETTGIISRDIDYNNNKWYNKVPYIVQLSWIFIDLKDNKILNKADYIIKLNKNIEIPKICSDIHGITNEISENKGINIDEILRYFISDISKADILVAHNIEFDKTMLRAELLRNNFNDIFINSKFEEYCTMKNSIYICKIERINMRNEPYFKWPKLIELYKKLFNTIPKNLHNSFNDVIVCLRCYYKMTTNQDLTKKNIIFKQLMSHIT
jgi:DNA polymerase-3 subunit epsilon